MVKPIILAFLLVPEFLSTVAALCCGPSIWFPSVFCYDNGLGSAGSPCCGTGRCDWICCDCSGHCRGYKPGEGEQKIEMGRLERKRQSFAVVNTSGSGKVTLNEYMEFVRKRANGTGAASVNTVVWERWFYRFDLAEKGYLTFDDIKD